MIARTWHGASPPHAPTSITLIAPAGVPDYKARPGDRGVFISRRTEGDVMHFLSTTF